MHLRLELQKEDGSGSSYGLPEAVDIVRPVTCGLAFAYIWHFSHSVSSRQCHAISSLSCHALQDVIIDTGGSLDLERLR